MSVDTPGGRRHVYVVALCYFVASFAALGLPPYLTAMLPELGDAKGHWAGILYVTPTVCTAVSAPLWGRLADRFGGKQMLVRAQFGLVASFVLAGFANNLPMFALALVLQGVFGGTFAASNTYLAGTLADRNGLSWALTLMQGAARASLVAAPIVVGSLSPVIAPHRQYVVMAALPLAAAVVVMRLPAPSATPAKRTSRADDRPAAPPEVSLSTLYALEVAFVFATVISFPYLIALLHQRLPGLPGFAGGVLFALPHLCYLVLAKPAHAALAERPLPGIAAGFALIAIATGAHLIVGSIATVIAVRILLGLGLTLGLVGLSVLAGQIARGRAPGRMFGTLEFATKVGAVLAGIVAAAGADVFGPAAPIACGAAGAALVTLPLMAPRLPARPARHVPRHSAKAARRVAAPPPSTPTPTAPPRPRPAPDSAYSPPATHGSWIMNDRPREVATDAPGADDVVAHTLLNCLLREVSGPEHQATVDDDHLLVRLPRRDILLRAPLGRVSLIGAHRFAGPVTALRDGVWTPVRWRELAEHISAELELRTGVRNEEFVDQVASSHQTVATGLARRAETPAQPDRYLASEQSLLFGHRFHPTPKARSGSPEQWWRHAPEAGRSFPVRLLAVRQEYARQQQARPGAAAALDALGDAPPGYVLLPVHPWQYSMLADRPALSAAMVRGDVLDLGLSRRQFAPTASVRTLYDGQVFLKFSLNVRITNCLRKNSAYELDGAVALTRLLTPIFDGLARRFPGCSLLAEPAYRTADLGDPGLYEGLGVIVRDGLADRLWAGVTPLLAAAIADQYPLSGAQVGRLLAGASLDEALTWLGAYLRLLVPPLMAAYFEHGVVLEPHLQNVVVGVDQRGMPAQVFLRDLEGTKLLPEHHGGTLAALPPEVAGPMTYDAERGWNRLAYCLLVNHVAELVAAIADQYPEHEAELWAVVRRVLWECAGEQDFPARFRALLSGVPLPAKANLLTRWARAADREAGYVPLPSPLSAGFLAGAGVDVDAGHDVAGAERAIR